MHPLIGVPRRTLATVTRRQSIFTAVEAFTKDNAERLSDDYPFRAKVETRAGTVLSSSTPAQVMDRRARRLIPISQAERARLTNTSAHRCYFSESVTVDGCAIGLAGRSIKRYTVSATESGKCMARSGGGKKQDKNGNKGQLGFEAEMFLAADKLRKNLEPSDYKHVVLGLIFLKYISDAFESLHSKLAADNAADAEDPDQYLAERVFWVPKEARWSHLRASAKQPAIGKIIDDAMLAIETRNPQIKGVLPKDYARPALDKVMLGELIDLISNIGLKEEAGRSKDILGRVYEYFLAQFAGAEGKRGGEFYTPRSVVRLLVEMLEPYKGRVYDPCCGSGGMFVQSERLLRSTAGALAIFRSGARKATTRPGACAG